MKKFKVSLLALGLLVGIIAVFAFQARTPFGPKKEVVFTNYDVYDASDPTNNPVATNLTSTQVASFENTSYNTCKGGTIKCVYVYPAGTTSNEQISLEVFHN